jgi:hypothetical protein
MANTKASIFIPHAMAEFQQIREQMAALQSKAGVLFGRYDMLGGSAMPGLDDTLMEPYGVTKAEFVAGMIDLNTAHNAVPLSGLLNCGSFVTVLKVTEGL